MDKLNKLNKLIDALTDLAVEATTYLRVKNGAPVQPALAPAAEEPAPKRSRAARKAADAPAAQPPAEQPAAAPAAAPAPAAANTGMDMLGLTGAAPAPAAPAPAATPAPAKREYTEAESSKVLFEVTEKYLLLTKNDTPPGKVALMDRMQNHYKVGKLQDLVHAQRVEWIEWLGGLIAAHR